MYLDILLSLWRITTDFKVSGVSAANDASEAVPRRLATTPSINDKMAAVFSWNSGFIKFSLW